MADEAGVTFPGALAYLRTPPHLRVYAQIVDSPGEALAPVRPLAELVAEGLIADPGADGLHATLRPHREARQL